MRGRATIEKMLRARLDRHLPAGTIPADGEAPTIEWVPASSPPIGETCQFSWDDGNTQVTVTFAPDDAVLVRYQRGQMTRIDAWKNRERGVVFDWTNLDADQN